MLTLTTPDGLSSGAIYIIKNHEREYFSTATPSENELYLTADSLINKTNGVPGSPGMYVNTKAYSNVPRSALTYAEFNSWRGLVSTGAHFNSFCSPGTLAFPMTVTWIILENVVIPATALTVPAGYNLRCILQLGTRWDADHPMASSAKEAQTIGQDSFNKSVMAGGK